MSITLFLVTGRTFTFHNVQIVHDNETVITFTYVAMSDSNMKRATFYKQHVAGISKF